MNKAEAVKLFAKQDIKVTVVKTDKAGEPLRDPETRKFVTEAVPLAVEHVIGVSEKGGTVGITTADGNKYSAAAK